MHMLRKHWVLPAASTAARVCDTTRAIARSSARPAAAPMLGSMPSPPASMYVSMTLARPHDQAYHAAFVRMLRRAGCVSRVVVMDDTTASRLDASLGKLRDHLGNAQNRALLPLLCGGR